MKPIEILRQKTKPYKKKPQNRVLFEIICTAVIITHFISALFESTDACRMATCRSLLNFFIEKCIEWRVVPDDTIDVSFYCRFISNNSSCSFQLLSQIVFDIIKLCVYPRVCTVNSVVCVAK